MSALASRVNRLWRAAHTFVSSRDLRALEDYWKAPLDDADVKPGDFEAECNELKQALMKIDEVGGEQFTACIHEFAEKNRLAYYAFMYKNSVEMSRRYPRGDWVTNDAEFFLSVVRKTREKAANSKLR